MNELYINHTIAEYLFMVLWMAFVCLIIYTYVRVNDLKEQRDYYRYLQQIREQAYKIDRNRGV
jgi:hypothetical protein